MRTRSLRDLGGGSLRRLGPLALLLLAVLCAGPSTAAAAEAPQLGPVWVVEVSAASATLHGEINPEGEPASYRFEYITDADYRANEAGGLDPFTGAAQFPGSLGAGSAAVPVSQHVSALRIATIYHYRLAASNATGPATSPPRTFTTEETGVAFSLPDGRGWELVSPADKNGGAVAGAGELHGGGVFQAAAAGPGEITYSSSASFGAEAQGAPQSSQYISRRSSSGWSTQNITAPTLSGAYGSEPNGVPYQLFSADLGNGLMLNGVHCRGEGSGCPVANPPLPGSGAPPGYQDYYLRDDEAGSYTALVTAANATLSLSASQFDLALAGSSPDLGHVVLSSCAALIPPATEVPGGEGCDPAAQNLYEWSGGVLSLVNVDPGATLAAPAGAVSADGARVYFTEGGKLWLREGGAAPQELAEGAQFETASTDGRVAFYRREEKLYRTDAGGVEPLSLITPAGGVTGVLGTSADGSTVYYQDASGLHRWHEGATSTVAGGPAAADPSDYPPATGTARVAADGSELLFLSRASLTGYDNADATSGQPDSEVYLYSLGGGLACLSCNPTGARPAGPSTIPGAIANGQGAGATQAYKPRNLSANGARAFFDSGDALVPLDSNPAPDVYQWEADGSGSCAKAGGCLSLISSGTGSAASFIDASADGSDTYFLTSASLVPADPGSADVYDARVGGGFPVPGSPIPCEGDACQPLPSAPEDPTVASLIAAAGNPPVHFPKVHKPKKPHKKHKHPKHTAHGSGRR